VSRRFRLIGTSTVLVVSNHKNWHRRGPDFVVVVTTEVGHRYSSLLGVYLLDSHGTLSIGCCWEDLVSVVVSRVSTALASFLMA
jgi:hypothetical protein